MLTALWVQPAPAAAGTREVRCGWIANPTPANWYLFDRQGRWVISEQGGHRAAGMRILTDLKQSEWVFSNVGSYGHGCACQTVDTDPRRKTITRLHSTRQQKLAVCRADRSLPRW